jgi:hypothetical protein
VGRETGSSPGTFIGLGRGKKIFKKKSSTTVDPPVVAALLVGNISIGSVVVGVALAGGVGTRSAVGGASSSACNVTMLFSVNCSDATWDGGVCFESESKVLSILLSISVVSDEEVVVVESPLPATSETPLAASSHHGNSRSPYLRRSSLIFRGSEDLLLLQTPSSWKWRTERRSWYHRSYVRLLAKILGHHLDPSAKAATKQHVLTIVGAICQSRITNEGDHHCTLFGAPLDRQKLICGAWWLFRGHFTVFISTKAIERHQFTNRCRTDPRLE